MVYKREHLACGHNLRHQLNADVCGGDHVGQVGAQKGVLRLQQHQQHAEAETAVALVQPRLVGLEPDAADAQQSPDGLHDDHAGGWS